MPSKQVEDWYESQQRHAQPTPMGKAARDESRMERIERKLDEILRRLEKEPKG